MIPRYTTKEMTDLWSEENKYASWLKVEQAVAWAQAKLGIIPKPAANRIAKAKFNIKQIEKFEQVIKHDLIAFLKSVETSIGPYGSYLHFGLTSYDVEDTALALRLLQACDFLIVSLSNLLNSIKILAIKHKNKLMMGRTHGMHAQPITFGIKCLSWFEETKRNITRLKQIRENLRFGKISGAVGTYTTVSPKVELLALKRLGLKVEPISTQIIPRDRHAELLTILALIAGGLERIATEIRNLQRSEIGEVAEPFASGQAGSSAMPHKRNPELCEKICGLSRVVRANALAGLETIAQWHERDISNSSVERITLPDSITLIHYMTNLLTKVLQGLVVFPDRMRDNILKSLGSYYSQYLMLALLEKNMPKKQAYKLVQELSFQSAKLNESFKEQIKANPIIKKYLNEKEIEKIFSIKNIMKNFDYIYRKAGIKQVGKGEKR